MECLGGNGYVEEAPLARLYREAPVNAIWEGSGNVMCLDVLRALAREPDAATAVLQGLAVETKGLPGADEAAAFIGKTFRREDGERVARLAVEKLALLAAVAALQLVGREPQALALSVITGLPATLAVVWLAIRIKKASFVDYLALYWPTWKQLLLGAVGLIVIVLAWEVVSRSLGREATPGFMTDLLKSGRDKGAAVMLLFAFSVAAP